MKKIMPLAASITLILIAGIFASAGTMAQFTDTETVGVHDINAGTLNLQVGDNDPCTIHIHLDNIAPGYYKELVYEVTNTGTLDGKLSFEFTAITNKENGRTEPEIAAGDTYGPLEGELDQYLLFRFRREYPNKAWICINSKPLNDFGGTTWSTLQDGTQMILRSGETWGIQFRFTLPQDTGNIVQSDSVEFDIIIHLDQA